MRIASVASIKSHFSAYLRDAARGPVVVTRNGKPAGVLLAVADEEEIERLLLAYSPRLSALLEGAQKRIRAGGGILHQDFWRRVGDTAPEPPGRKRKSQPKPRAAR